MSSDRYVIIAWLLHTELKRGALVATIKQLCGSGCVPRRWGSFSQGKRYRDERRREKKVDEDGGTPRRDGMEMVGDWNPRGESLPRRSKLSGDASVTELTLPCAFVRKRGLPDSRFLCITHAATYTCTYGRTHVHVHPRVFSSVSLSAYRRAHRPVRFPPSWPPRGPSPFRLPRYGLGSSYTRPSVPLLLFLSFLRTPALDCYVSNLSGNCLSLSVSKKKNFEDFVRKIFDVFVVVSHRFTLN